MKLSEVYLSKKEKYIDSVILIESGIFIEVYGEESGIINSLLGYKVTSSSNMLKLGFPKKAIDKVLLVLRSKHINYLVLDNKASILDKKKYKDNKYIDYISNKDLLIRRENRINNIYNKLRNSIDSNNIDKVLSSIEELV